MYLPQGSQCSFHYTLLYPLLSENQHFSFIRFLTTEVLYILSLKATWVAMLGISGVSVTGSLVYLKTSDKGQYLKNKAQFFGLKVNFSCRNPVLGCFNFRQQINW